MLALILIFPNFHQSTRTAPGTVTSTCSNWCSMMIPHWDASTSKGSFADPTLSFLISNATWSMVPGATIKLTMTAISTTQTPCSIKNAFFQIVRRKWFMHISKYNKLKDAPWSSREGIETAERTEHEMIMKNVSRGGKGKRIGNGWLGSLWVNFEEKLGTEVLQH